MLVLQNLLLQIERLVDLFKVTFLVLFEWSVIFIFGADLGRMFSRVLNYLLCSFDG